MTSKTLLLSPALLLVFVTGFAYAEPLYDVNVVVQEYDGISASVKMNWNQDETVTKYQIGCVSCMPNISEFSFEDSITLDSITPFPNSSNAMLYLIAYDVQDQIMNARQFLVDLTQ
ncbi:MAG: hypothetical protein OEM18_03300 [Nitrosopumilus sp.]|jgi:cytochrome c oxidase assembly protein Cox11|nr:hypothetical protein [Nitrosopumilus sp.]MDH3501434.1 hypothetical protein [Nitrosopumilus sp.]